MVRPSEDDVGTDGSLCRTNTRLFLPSEGSPKARGVQEVPEDSRALAECCLGSSWATPGAHSELGGLDADTQTAGPAQ